MKGLKYIAILLLVNISILVGHNLVPHHHHVASLTHPSSNECPDTHKCPDSTHGHHDEDSGTKYCHAFNNIAFVKYSQSQVPMPEKLVSLMMVASQGVNQEPNRGISTAPGFLLKLPILSPELTGILSLRGPPVLS